ARQNADEPPARLEVARANRRAGDIRQFVGEHAAAQQAYGQALAAARTLAAEFPGEPAFPYEQALCCARLAEALLASGQLPGAALRGGGGPAGGAARGPPRGGRLPRGAGARPPGPGEAPEAEGRAPARGRAAAAPPRHPGPVGEESPRRAAVPPRPGRNPPD